MTWLLTALGWAKKAADALFALVRRYPLYCLLVGLLALQTARIEGFAFIDGFKDRLAVCASKRAQLEKAIAEAKAKAETVRQTTVTIAKEQDREHETRRAANRTLADAYIASHRVRPESGISAPAKDETPGSPENAPAVPVVLMSEQDVRVAAELQAYSQTCYRWGQDLIAAGLAD